MDSTDESEGDHDSITAVAERLGHTDWAGKHAAFEALVQLAATGDHHAITAVVARREHMDWSEACRSRHW
eukprot:CAMPEP_0172823186 /NCGR_PEP_ID=MMETSP1075-20121228/17157_1 /TAXON_ID=2916 /ORGANISM="Ceratium fusus, Strain PA161109" /LENGTH=69 /DNA_ID=CAMNT_0013664285 /DNA_START=229 /DNA_END=435 /DNA_ORIENTATION=+